MGDPGRAIQSIHIDHQMLAVVVSGTNGLLPCRQSRWQAARLQMISPEFIETSQCQGLDVGQEREARVALHAQSAGRVIDAEWMGAHNRAQPFLFERFGGLKAAQSVSYTHLRAHETR